MDSLCIASHDTALSRLCVVSALHSPDECGQLPLLSICGLCLLMAFGFLERHGHALLLMLLLFCTAAGVCPATSTAKGSAAYTPFFVAEATSGASDTAAVLPIDSLSSD